MTLVANSSSFEANIEKATTEHNRNEKEELYRDICLQIMTTYNGPKDCLCSIIRRMHSKVPSVAMQSLDLLDACVQRCGIEFRKEMSTVHFLSECRSIINDSKVPLYVCHKLKSLIKRWAENEFKDVPSLSYIPQLYNDLKSEGHEFPDEHELCSKLKDGHPEQTKGQDVRNSPSFKPKNTQNDPRQVKALYDFEAAEENELSFTADEIINVLDDSNPNWWRGFTQRGEGLFPSNFVTADLTAIPERDLAKPRRSVHFHEEVEVRIVDSPRIVEVNKDKIDEALGLIQNADHSEESDSNYLLQLEEQCKAMGPLIDQELEKIDRHYNELSQFKENLMGAFQMYHNLMSQNFQPSSLSYSEHQSTPMPPKMEFSSNGCASTET